MHEPPLYNESWNNELSADVMVHLTESNTNWETLKIQEHLDTKST